MDMINPFGFPILVEVLPDGEALADEFCKLARGLRSADENGGLMSEAWHDAEVAESSEEYKKHGYTSFVNQNLCFNSDFDAIHKATVAQKEKYCNMMGAGYEFYIQNSWASIYGDNHYIPEHIHSFSHLSMCFYAAASEGTGEIVFRNPAYASYGMIFDQHCMLFNDQFRVQPQKGMMIVFPSFMPHYTRPHKDTSERIIFSSNSVFKSSPLSNTFQTAGASEHEVSDG